MGCGTTFAQSYAATERYLQRLLDRGVADLEKTPAILIGVVLPDTTYVYALGTVRRGADLPPTPQDVFEIGGLTHLFTAALARQLERDGRLDLDRSPNDYLPRPYRNPAAADLSVRDLLTHTSGLPRLPYEFAGRTGESEQPFVAFTSEMVYDFYRTFPFQRKRRKYTYSPYGYAVLDLVLERAGGASLDELYRIYLTEPLRLPHTQSVRTAATSRVQGYRSDGVPAPNYRFDSFRAAGSLSSTLEDLLRFVRLQMNQEPSTLHREVFLKNQMARHPTGYERHAYSGEGWHLVIPRKRFYPVLLQTANTAGYHADIAMVPLTGTGVVVLSNANQPIASLAFELLRWFNNDWRRRRVGRARL